MRYAVQSGLIDYNHAQVMAGAIAVAKREHRPASDFERIPALLDRIDCIKGRKLTKLAIKLTLMVFIGLPDDQTDQSYNKVFVVIDRLLEHTWGRIAND